MTKFKSARHWLANFVYWQWRKMSLLSAFAYMLLIQNGDDSKQKVEDLETYLAEDDHIYVGHVLKSTDATTRRRALRTMKPTALREWQAAIDEVLK